MPLIRWLSQRQTDPILPTGTHLRTVSPRSFVNAFRVGRNNPNVASFPTRLLHDIRVVGRVAQHHHLGPRRQRQVADQLRRRLGRRPMRDPLLLTILLGVMRNLKRDAEARRRGAVVNWWSSFLVPSPIRL